MNVHPKLDRALREMKKERREHKAQERKRAFQALVKAVQ
jgi:hypothetical protein